MSVSNRMRSHLSDLRRFAFVVLAAVCLGWQGAAAPVSHAAPAHQDGIIAFGTGVDPGWTVVNADGSGKHNVTPSGAGYVTGAAVITVSYSPDGKQVAFVADTGYGRESIWVAAVDGTGARQVVSSVVSIYQLAWTPDSTKIVYGYSVIEAVSAMGGSPVGVFTDAESCGDQLLQVTSRDEIVFTRWGRACLIRGLVMYRPGDRSPSNLPILSTATSSIPALSPDATRAATFDTLPDGSKAVLVGEAGNDLSTYRTMAWFRDAGETNVSEFVRFTPTGQILYAFPEPGGRTRIQEVADSVGSPVRDVTESSTPLRFLTSSYGTSNLPTEPEVDRVGGVDRIDTAVKASRWSFDGRDQPGRRAVVAVLARSDLFPDALSGTALAVDMGGPLLLTPSGVLDRAVGDELQRVLVPGSPVYLLGGTAALSPAVADGVDRLGFMAVRLGGFDRYVTAASIATAISGDHPNSVLLATGTNFPDALTAGAAAGQRRFSHDGVVLLTDGSSMPPATRAYLAAAFKTARSQSRTVSVYAVGGPASSAMDAAFPHQPNLTRLVGADRFATAAQVATSALFGYGAPGRSSVAAIATGLDFPDAMSGGALIGAMGGPLLLTNSYGLPPQEVAILKTGYLNNIAVLGGKSAVSARVLVGTANAVFGSSVWTSFTNRTAPPLP